MTRDDRPTLILPVEIQVREWDAKLLLACAAAERGYRTIIGCHARMNQRLHLMPRSFYIAKGVTRLSLRMFRIANWLGHVLLAWDEEALVYMSPDIYLRRKIFEPSLAATDALFAWGEDSAELWRRVPAGKNHPIHITGNPRGDLLRPELRPYFDHRVRELRGRYGDFLLFNSNFGVVSHFLPDVTRLKRPTEDVLAQELPAHAVGTRVDPHMAAYRHRVFERFQQVLPLIAEAFPDHTLVVRPHPSGSPEPWRRVLAGVPNAVVEGRGNVLPWILASQLMLHNGCTSAVEAFRLGRTAVAFEPLGHDLYDIPLPNALSRSARSPEALLETLGDALRDPPVPTPEQRRLADRHMAAQVGPLATERILDHIDALAADGALERKRSSPTDWLGGWTRCALRGVEKRLNGFRRAHHNSTTYIRHRFPDLDVADCEARIELLRATLGRFSEVRVRPWRGSGSKNIFLIDTP
ncbi:MAG: surface carbohydrate biosynthesis protein [Acidobacteriota bacterium]